MPLDNELIEVGHIIGAHGVRGQVKVFSNTSPRENIVTYSPWQIEQHGVSKTLKISGKCQGKSVVAKIEGIEDRDQAQAMAGAKIFIQHSQLPSLPDGDYYWSQLIGLRVINLRDEELGVIDHMLETGANDVMVVIQGDRERLVPYVMDEFIKSIDLVKNQIVVDWDAEF